MHLFSRGAVARAAAVIALSALPAVARAQANGSLAGVITSDAGPIQGARVALESPAAVVVITDAAGKYSIRELAAGQYQLLVTSIGYKPVRRTIDITNAPASADIRLEPGSILLPGVVTTANRLPMDAARIAATINTLEPEQIRTSPAREAQDLLRELPSVELPRTSSVVSGNAQIVSMRGVDEGRTVVLFDGIPVTDAWGEWVDWSRVPNGMLDRVEVIGGGTSSLYGNGAMGGMISFFSRPMAPGSISLQLDAGDRDSRHGYLGAGLPIAGAWSAMINADYADGGGYRLIDSVGPGCPAVVPATGTTPETTAPCQIGTLDNDNHSIRRNLYTRLNYNPSANLSAFVTGHAFADNRALGTPLARASRDQMNVDLGLNYGQYASGMFSLRAYTGRQFERARSSAIRAPATAGNVGAQPSCGPAGTIRICEDSSVSSVIPSHDWGASAQWSRTGWMHLESFSVGADLRHMQGAFDEIDYNTTCPGANCGRFLRAIWSGGSQSLSGAFVQAIANPLTPLRVELSARVDHWDNTDAMSVDSALASTAQNTKQYPSRHQTTFNPRLGVRYELLSNLAIHGAVYTAFRAPNLAELYRKQINANASQVTLPNPELAPERALGREVGFNFSPVKWVDLKATYYQAEYKDFNVPTTLTATAPDTTPCGPAVATCRQRQNVTATRSEGVEGTIGIRPIASLLLSGSVSYDDARQQSNLAASVTDDTKPHINRVPSPKQVVKGVFTDRTYGTWTGIWRHEGHTTTLQGLVLQPYTVMDANVQREIIPGFTGFFSIENVMDEKYQVNQAGTGASTVMSFGLPRTWRFGMMIDR